MLCPRPAVHCMWPSDLLWQTIWISVRSLKLHVGSPVILRIDASLKGCGTIILCSDYWETGVISKALTGSVSCVCVCCVCLLLFGVLVLFSFCLLVL